VTDFAPRLRPLEAFPVQHEGRRVLALRDPAGYTDAIVLLPRVLLEIVSLFDGEHSIADIQAAIMRQHGELVPRERITEIADALDEQGFLDSSHFAERRAAIDRAFLEAPTRPAAHGGGAYPLRSEEHTSELQSRFDLVCRLLLEKKKKIRQRNLTYKSTSTTKRHRPSIAIQLVFDSPHIHQPCNVHSAALSHHRHLRPTSSLHSL